MMTSRFRLRVPFFVLGLALTGLSVRANAAEKLAHWVGVWAAAPRNLPVPVAEQSRGDVTYRDIVHISPGGHPFRVQLTNEFGVAPLKIGRAHIALSDGKGKIKAGTDHALLFRSLPTVTVPNEAFVLNDPIDIDVPALRDVTVSIFVPAQTIKVMTIHPLGNSTTYQIAGNALSATSLDKPMHLASWYPLKGVEVAADVNAAAIVTLGDSITDRRSSTPDSNSCWPADLARRLQANAKTANLSVLNEGISGSRVLHDFDGPSALARFDRDVLAQAGVKYLVILESINDIGRTTIPKYPDQEVTAQDLIFGLTQPVERAHQHGIKVIGATLTPYEGAAYYSESGEKDRQSINAWARGSGVYDGVIDFDKAVQDPVHPSRFRPDYDDGHHLHPNDGGYTHYMVYIFRQAPPEDATRIKCPHTL